MSATNVLSDDLTPKAEIVPIADLVTSFELIVSLEREGALTPTSLQLPEVDWNTYEAVGYFLGRFNRSCSWWIGDWLVYGQANFEDRFSQAAAITGLSEQTLLARMFVSENVPISRRQPGVSFSCHAKVARLKPDEQTRWLKAAAKGGWSYAELSERMKAARKDTRPALPGLEEVEINTAMVIEVAQAILRDATQDDDPGFYRVPVEDIARLKGAFGIE